MNNMPSKKVIPTGLGTFICKADGTRYKTAAALASHERALAKKAAEATGKTPQAGATPLVKGKKTHHRAAAPAPPDAIARLKAMKAEAPQIVRELEGEIKALQAKLEERTGALNQAKLFLPHPVSDPAMLTHSAGSSSTHAAG